MRKWWKWLSLIAFLGALLLADALWWEPDSLVVRRVEFYGLPHWRGRLRIAALSDLHVGSRWIDEAKLAEVVRRTNAEHPDIVVILGDFMNGAPRRGERPASATVTPEGIAQGLRLLTAPLGVFAVLGNHDRWHDGPRVEEALRNVGIHVLENRAERLLYDGHAFWLGGLADLWTALPNIHTTLAQTDPAEPTILFTHNPDIFPQVPERVSLTLGGHTHGGQVDLPFIGTPVTVSRYRKGHIVEGGRHLFVTTGIGTSIAPIRFRVTPEIVILSLR
jgi:uncharacterized protein